jgi:protein TonB
MMDWAARDRALSTAIGASIVLHAVLLSFQFKFPDSRWKSMAPPLDVVLVNARTLAQARESRSRVNVEALKQAPAEDPALVNGRDLADRSLAMMKLEAEIQKNIDEYQKRPRKKFIGARAAEYRFAQYEEEWRAKVERVGTLNYPAEARGKFYGTLRLTVTLRPDGSVESVELDRSSGLKVLDAAAFRIVRMAAPFSKFPASIRRDTDLLVITRTWFFGQGDKIWTE